MFDFFSDIYERKRLHEAENQARHASKKTSDLKEEVRELSHRLDRLALVSHAMWELLREHTKLTDQDIRAKVRQIDLLDGVRDRKITPQTSVCSGCGRPLNTKISSCPYCGKDNTKKVFHL